MAKRGRPPKSREERIANGNAGKRRLPPPTGQAAAPPAASVPANPLAPPPELGAKARWMWERLTGELQQSGVLQQTDFGSLLVYCDAFADYVEANETIKAAGGADYKTSTGNIREHPAVKRKREAGRLLHELGKTLGLSPLWRSKTLAAIAAIGGQLPLFGSGQKHAEAPKPDQPPPEAPPSNDPVGRFAIH